jgi:hypothetical protein
MGILNFGKKVGVGAAERLGRAPASIMSSKAAMGAIGVGALALGFGSRVGPATKDAALGAAFGDENADQYFTGRDLDSRFLLGSMTGGLAGGLMKATAPGDALAANPGMLTVGAGEAMAGGVIGAGIGAGIFGGPLGAKAGAGLAGRIPRGGYIGKGIAAMGLGAMGAIAGAGIGGAIGGSMGVAFPAAASIGGHINRNQEFYRQSPYSSSSSTASQLSASGDIVLGMHNSRRGY